MVTPIDIERLLQENPQVDPEKLKEGLDLTKKLSECGLAKSASRIAPPDGRYRARVIDSRGHRNTVQLKKP
jgi:hypothetical protein